MIKHLFYKNINHQGSVIISVLWAIMILSTLAISLGRLSRVDISFSKYVVTQTKRKLTLQTGFHYILSLMAKAEAINEISPEPDTLFSCGLTKEQIVNDPMIFQPDLISQEFVIGRPFVDEAGALQWIYGIEDEERRINLNAMTSQNIDVFRQLLLNLGYSDEVMQKVTFGLLDWVDQDRNEIHPQYGYENSVSVDGLSVQVKNLPLDSLEELKLIHGVDEKLLNDIRPYVTIYPKDDTFVLNFNTASYEVLRAISMGLSGPATNTDKNDGESLAKKIVDFRSGRDLEDRTSDDRDVELNDMQLNSSERVLFLLISQYQIKNSQLFRIPVWYKTEDFQKLQGYEWVVESNQWMVFDSQPITLYEFD